MPLEVRPATVVTIPRPPASNEAPPSFTGPIEPRASVTLQRETATFSVPVSEAVMPDSLKAAMQAFRQRLATDDANESASDEFTALREIPLDDQLSDHDRALIRRIAPPAAE
jgi:hypothetical protein